MDEFVFIHPPSQVEPRSLSQGGLMAARVFDTYMPGAEEPMIQFLNSISDGRILCMGIMVSDGPVYHDVLFMNMCSAFHRYCNTPMSQCV